MIPVCKTCYVASKTFIKTLYIGFASDSNIMHTIESVNKINKQSANQSGLPIVNIRCIYLYTAVPHMFMVFLWMAISVSQVRALKLKQKSFMVIIFNGILFVHLIIHKMFMRLRVMGNLGYTINGLLAYW